MPWQNGRSRMTQSSRRLFGNPFGRPDSTRSGSLEWAGIIDKPIDALLFNNFAVIVVLSTSWITYTVIPIYASMKAIDTNLFQAAADLGAGWWTIMRRILLPQEWIGHPLRKDYVYPTDHGGMPLELDAVPLYERREGVPLPPPKPPREAGTPLFQPPAPFSERPVAAGCKTAVPGQGVGGTDH